MFVVRIKWSKSPTAYPIDPPSSPTASGMWFGPVGEGDRPPPPMSGLHPQGSVCPTRRLSGVDRWGGRKPPHPFSPRGGPKFNKMERKFPNFWKIILKWLKSEKKLGGCEAILGFCLLLFEILATLGFQFLCFHFHFICHTKRMMTQLDGWIVRMLNMFYMFLG